MGFEDQVDAVAEPDLDLEALYADVASADLQPLWLQRGLLPAEPDRLSPHVWRWAVLRILAQRAGALVGVDRGGDRRVLSLSHPDLNGLPFATHTLWGGIQYLNPGELAPAHRHSPSALRFVLEGSGVWTLVNGDPIQMEPGDLVLTPSYCWHEHHNSGESPMIWFDGLDLPLVRNLDAVFFEEGPDELADYVPAPMSSSQKCCSASPESSRLESRRPLSRQATADTRRSWPTAGSMSSELSFTWPRALITDLWRCGTSTRSAAATSCPPCAPRSTGFCRGNGPHRNRSWGVSCGSFVAAVARQ